MITQWRHRVIVAGVLLLLQSTLRHVSAKKQQPREQQQKESRQMMQPDYRGFYNLSGCLYAYMDGGELQVKPVDGDLTTEDLELDSLKYDSERSQCLQDPRQEGLISFSFKLQRKSKFKSAEIDMKILSSPSEGTWEVSHANLTLVRADVNKKRTFALRVGGDIYASLSHSFSCNELVLSTIRKKKPDNDTGKMQPQATITLQRFQLQPFEELKTVVFAPSYDCSQWISIPGLMGLVLVLFMTSVAIIGVYFLQKVETNDFKFNREGLLFTQSQMDANKSSS